MSIKFKCGKCGQDYELEDDAAGQKAECQCGAEMTVPAKEIPQAVPDSIPLKSKPLSIKRQQPSEPPPPPPAVEQVATGGSAGATGICPKCKTPVKPDAVICVNCGHNLKLGMNVKTIAKAKVAGSFGLAIGVCAAAAIISGLVWAGIAIFLNMEIGWIAIGVGALTGFAATIFTEERSMRLGLAAALLAIVGLLCGKLITANYVFKREIDKMLRKEQGPLQGYVYLQMVSNNEIQKDLLDWLDKNDPDEVKIPDNLKDAYEKLIKTLDSRAATLKQEEKDKVYNFLVNKELESYSYFYRIKVFLRAWDLLWFGLAILAAWKIGTGESQEG